MSAPDYNDPRSRLKPKLRLRPMRGSGPITALAAGLFMYAAILCMIAFLASFLPGVEGAGSPFWFLAGAAAFAIGAAIFYAAHKFFRRYR